VRIAPYYVYIIRCEDGSFYTGYTQDLEKRMKLHEEGKGGRYTQMYKPKKLVYYEIFKSRADAMRRERSIKNLTHDQKLELIKSNGNYLPS